LVAALRGGRLDETTGNLEEVEGILESICGEVGGSGGNGMSDSSSFVLLEEDPLCVRDNSNGNKCFIEYKFTCPPEVRT